MARILNLIEVDRVASVCRCRINSKLAKHEDVGSETEGKYAVNEKYNWKHQQNG
jgi:hypothetical protein